MPAEVSMDYGVVQDMANSFQASGHTLADVSRMLEAAIEILRGAAFVGLIGSEAAAEYLENIKPQVDRLSATCREFHLDLEGAIISLRDGDYSGSQRFAGGDGRGFSGIATGGRAFGARVGSPPSFWEQISNAIIANQRAYKFTGNFVDAMGMLADLIPDPTLNVAANLVVAAVGVPFTYLEHFDEEPNLIRGGGIAVYDAALGFALDYTPVGIAQRVNTIFQLGGQLEVAFMDYSADHMAIPLEVQRALHHTADDLYEAMEAYDLTNVRYDVARLAWDFQFFPLQYQHLDEDVVHLFGSVGGIVKSQWWDLPNAMLDTSVIGTVANVTNYVNHTNLPPRLKDAVNNLGAEISTYMQDTNVVEMVVDLLPFNF